MLNKPTDLSYAMPLLARILSHFFAPAHQPARALPGPWTLGSYGIYFNVVGVVFLLFTSVTFNFPTLYPVDRENMNYTSAAIGVIGLVSLVTWIVQGRSRFTGPRVGVVDARASSVEVESESPRTEGEKGEKERMADAGGEGMARRSMGMALD